jgi:dTMP kinase
MKGKLIVIEGTDGSGKATQSKELVKKLISDGFMVEYIEFPQYGSPSAKMVEEYLNGNLGKADDVSPYQASIFYAIDRFAKSKEIKKWIDDGKIIICNRYISANKGHQAGKIKDKQDIDKFLDWLDNLEFNIFKIPKPDKTILLYMPQEIGQKLVDKKGHRDYIGGTKRDIHEDDIEHLNNAAKAYFYVAKKENWDIINCSEDNENPLPINAIHNKIYNCIKEIISKN